MTTTKVELVGGPWDGMRAAIEVWDAPRIEMRCGGFDGIPARVARYMRVPGFGGDGHKLYEFAGYLENPEVPR